jgi:hypothetical protein
MEKEMEDDKMEDDDIEEEEIMIWRKMMKKI